MRNVVRPAGVGREYSASDATPPVDVQSPWRIRGYRQRRSRPALSGRQCLTAGRYDRQGTLEPHRQRRGRAHRRGRACGLEPKRHRGISSSTRASPEPTLDSERPMVGSAKPRRLDERIAVSLEALIPPNHFYRHLEAKFDLGFVRDWTHDLYADRGHIVHRSFYADYLDTVRGYYATEAHQTAMRK